MKYIFNLFEGLQTIGKHAISKYTGTLFCFVFHSFSASNFHDGRTHGTANHILQAKVMHLSMLNRGGGGGRTRVKI